MTDIFLIKLASLRFKRKLTCEIICKVLNAKNRPRPNGCPNVENVTCMTETSEIEGSGSWSDKLWGTTLYMIPLSLFRAISITHV